MARCSDLEATRLLITRPGLVLLSYLVAGLALVATLTLGLLTVLLAGLAVWEIGNLAAPTAQADRSGA